MRAVSIADMLKDEEFIAFLIGHGVRDIPALTWGELHRLAELYRSGLSDQ